MKLLKISLLVLSALTAVTLLAGCTGPVEKLFSPAAKETEPPAQTTPDPAAAENTAGEPSAVPEETPAESGAGEVLREFRFLTQPYGPNALFTYDRQGRLEHITVSSDPDDFTNGFDLIVAYGEDGAASVSIDPEDTAGLENTPMMPMINAVETRADGTLQSLDAFSGALIYLEFNDQGLPTYFCCAQDDLGYQITYRTAADGRWEMESATYVYGHYLDHTDTPQEDHCVPAGTFLYEAE